jgi:hypothetical protein
MAWRRKDETKARNRIRLRIYRHRPDAIAKGKAYRALPRVKMAARLNAREVRKTEKWKKWYCHYKTTDNYRRTVEKIRLYKRLPDVITRAGVVRKKYLSLPHNKIRDILYRQSARYKTIQRRVMSRPKYKARASVLRNSRRGEYLEYMRQLGISNRIIPTKVRKLFQLIDTVNKITQIQK